MTAPARPPSPDDRAAARELRALLQQERERADLAESLRDTYHAQLLRSNVERVLPPIRMLLWCPECMARHIDVGEFATKPHHTHACQECGMVWRPAVVATAGVLFLPGFKNDVLP